jgi:3,4-dihydroxy 2-butanone 4-phosphate synthase / GTP cyclohydrolase II
MHDDGSMMRLPELRRFAAEHGLKVGTIADLIAYRLARRSASWSASPRRPADAVGEFRVVGYRDTLHDAEHVAMVLGDVGDAPPRWCACTASASPATRCTACAATAASSATPR